MSEIFDESDQAGIFSIVRQAHLNRDDHQGKIKEDCEFCKNFLMVEEWKPPINSNPRFLIFDTLTGKEISEKLKKK